MPISQPIGLPDWRADAEAPVLDVYLSVFGDLLFGEYSSRLAETTPARAGGRTFMSRFGRRREGPGGAVVRAWHCADIPFATTGGALRICRTPDSSPGAQIADTRALWRTAGFPLLRL